jgi:N-acetyltransferase
MATMELSKTIGYDAPEQPADRHTLRRLFDWFVGRGLPYETVSNLQQNVLIKSAEQMAEAVARGFGGHCVEHAVLFAAFLREQGFDARFVNADYHDHLLGISIALAKPFVLVCIDGHLYVCDPYYRRLLLPVPDTGEIHSGNLSVRRVDADSFVIELRRNGTVANQDLVRESSSLEDRQWLFRDRYAEFTPFGITAPYYQVMRPARRAVYYDPHADEFVAHDETRVESLNEYQLAECGWIPRRYRELIPALAARNRREREHAAEFLQTGAYTPPYLRLRRPLSSPR